MISGTRPNGTIATYTCDDGFRLHGNATRICDTGNWTGTVPVCIESKPCCTYMALFSVQNIKYHAGINIIGYV